MATATQTDRLAAIRERLNGIPDGPWEGDVTGVYDDISRKLCPMYIDSFGNLDMEWEEKEPIAAATAAFMAAAREDVPWLLAEVERLRAALVEERATALQLRDELEEFRPRAWPTASECAYQMPYARGELVAERKLPPD